MNWNPLRRRRGGGQPARDPEHDSEETLVSELNPAQRSAATHGEGHALVLAGAGTGKTRTIIGRAGYLIGSGVPAHRILVLTFTRKSAAEIRERVSLHLGARSEGLAASTFHTWCLSQITRRSSLFGTERVNVIDRDDQLQLYKSLRPPGRDTAMPAARALCDLYSYVRNTRCSLTEGMDKLDLIVKGIKNEIAALIENYEAKKRDSNYVDYDDLLDIVALQLAQQEDVRLIVCSQYDHVLVDEMQDTNPIQWEILSSLSSVAQLFCVGDDAQSIYGFRGADFRNVHTFRDRLPNSTVYKLEDNYRSTQEILDVANWLIAESPLKYERKLRAVRGKGEKPILVTLNSEWEEGAWIAKDIKGRFDRSQKWADNLVLIRSAYSGRAIEAALVEAGIPYMFIGGTQLFQAAHVKDLLAILRTIVNHHDELGWLRYLELWEGVGPTTAKQLTDQLLTTSDSSKVPDVLARNPRIPRGCVDAWVQVRGASANPADAYRVALRTLLPVLAHRYRDENWKSRKQDLDLITQLAEQHDTISGFIHQYILDPIHLTAVSRAGDTDLVTLSTIHAAKGTERPVCYVCDVSPGRFPLARIVGLHDEEEEERRVLYVALTRAKDRLVLTRNLFSSFAGDGSNPASYFLMGLPENLIKGIIPQASPQTPDVSVKLKKDRPKTKIDLT